MKLFDIKNKHLLASFLFVLATAEGHAGLQPNLTPGFLDAELDAQRVSTAIVQHALKIEGTEFRAILETGALSEPVLRGRLESDREKVYVTLSGIEEYRPGDQESGRWVQLGTKAGDHSSPSQVYMLKFYDNAALTGDALGTLYLGGNSIPSSRFMQKFHPEYRGECEQLRKVLEGHDNQLEEITRRLEHLQGLQKQVTGKH
jgi:hypothetical protein